MKDAAEVWRSLRLRRPGDREGLRLWVGVFLGLWMPERGVCAGHGTPLDYLCHSFFEEPGDAVVWACRGGGKTMVGAVATLLDMIFKPGVQVRILGGSLEQSEKMYGYLKRMVQERFPELMEGEATQRRLGLKNGSRVEVLAQSDRSVRGMRVQKLRCDEVELFDRAVWEAAQLTTRSAELTAKDFGALNRTARRREGAVQVRGAVEVFSTMHRPRGLMEEIIEKPAGRKIFSWCVLDVLEKCPLERNCEGCGLWEECGGRAKEGSGFVGIDDALAMKGRVSKGVWEQEMLCGRPRWEDAVFGGFSRGRHVRAAGELRVGMEVEVEGRVMRAEKIVAGVDFGFAGAFACVWLMMLREKETAKRCVWVLDEMVERGKTVAANAAGMRERGLHPAIVYCDVAGRQRNGQTGVGDESVLRGAGFAVRSNWMRIEPGLEVIRGLAEGADGKCRLFIDPRCVQTIVAFENYRRGADGRAEKDGVHDHVMDALRYGVCGEMGGGGKIEVRWY